MHRIVEEYADEVIQRRTRRIHLVESVQFDVSLWHGGRLVTKCAGRSLREAADREADNVARRLGIGPSSTLHVRIEETVTRRRQVLLESGGRDGDHVYDSSAEMRGLGVSRRHVWDSHHGELEASLREVGFEVVQWIGFRDEACDPGGQLRAYFTQAEAERMHDDDFWCGFGTGPATISGFARAEEEPGHIDRKGRQNHWAKVTLTGTCGIHCPPDFTEPKLQDFLQLCGIDVHLDRHAMGNLPNRWDHYVGLPAASMRWLPQAALPAPVAP